MHIGDKVLYDDGKWKEDDWTIYSFEVALSYQEGGGWKKTKSFSNDVQFINLVSDTGFRRADIKDVKLL